MVNPAIKKYAPFAIGITIGVIIGIVVALNPLALFSHKKSDVMQETAGTEEVQLKPVMLSAEQQKQVGITAEPVRYRNMSELITAPATVITNDTLNITVTAKVAGRVVSNNNLQKGDIIHPKQEIYRIYSPQLIVAQQEYLDSLMDNSKFGLELQEASYNRLLLWGFTDAEITRLGQIKLISEVVPVRSSYSGAIANRYVANDTWVNIGDKIFDLVDTQLLVSAEVYEADAYKITPGVNAVFKIGDKSMPVYISYVSFESNPQTHTISVRGAAGDKTLRPNEFGTMEIMIPTRSALAIPQTSVVRANNKTIVYLKDSDDMFSPAVVKVSENPDQNGYVEVIEGLFEGDEVVTQGGFYLYSQSKLADLNKSMAGMMGMGGNTQQAKGYELNKVIEVDDMKIKGYFVGGGAVGKLGSDMIMFEIRDKSGKPIENASVSGEYTMAMEGMAVNKNTLRYDNGKYSDNLNLSMAGPWHIELDIHGKKYTFVFDVK